jgi:signal transduction histidine kinase
MNLDIIYVRTVEEAIKLYDDERFDAILCDYNLEGEKGTEFLDYVRKVKKDNIPFAVITEDDRRDIIIESLNSGADYFFEKSEFIGSPEENMYNLHRIVDLKLELQGLSKKERLSKVFDITVHDVKNLLMAISMIAELIKEISDKEEIKSYADNILNRQKAIQEAIEFSRDYLGLGAKNKKWNPVHDIIEKIKKNIALQIDIVNSVPPTFEVFGDALIEKAIYTLFDNAIRHGNATKMECSVSVKGDMVEIIFQDNGSGVSLSQKDLIFGQGFGKNTGYGLFFCKEVLNMSDMDIKEIGNESGACFVVIVPDSRCRTK